MSKNVGYVSVEFLYLGNFHSDAKDEFLAKPCFQMFSLSKAVLCWIGCPRGRYLHEKRVNFFVTNASPMMTGP